MRKGRTREELWAIQDYAVRRLRHMNGRSRCAYWLWWHGIYNLTDTLLWGREPGLIKG